MCRPTAASSSLHGVVQLTFIFTIHKRTRPQVTTKDLSPCNRTTQDNPSRFSSSRKPSATTSPTSSVSVYSCPLHACLLSVSHEHLTRTCVRNVLGAWTDSHSSCMRYPPIQLCLYSGNQSAYDNKWIKQYVYTAQSGSDTHDCGKIPPEPANATPPGDPAAPTCVWNGTINPAQSLLFAKTTTNVPCDATDGCQPGSVSCCADNHKVFSLMKDYFPDPVSWNYGGK